MPTQSQPTGNARAESGYPPQQAGMSIWPKLPGAIMQRFLTSVWGVTDAFENPIKKASLLLLRKCTKSCPQFQGLQASPAAPTSPRLGFPF